MILNAIVLCVYINDQQLIFCGHNKLDGRFAVNAICTPTGMINGNITFETKEIPSLIFAYRISGIVDSIVVHGNVGAQSPFPQP